MQSEPTTTLEFLAREKLYAERQLDDADADRWGTHRLMWRNRLAEIEEQIAEARKEVMPHPEDKPGPDTTPPQASEPGVTAPVEWFLRGADIDARTGFIDESVQAAATEIRRLRTREAEQAARIAALEAGLQRAVVALQPFADRVFWDNGDCTVTDTFRCTYDDFVSARMVSASVARLLPQEGK
jgi:hypothetical protein